MSEVKLAHAAKKYFKDQVDFYLDAGKLDSLPSTLIKIEKGGKVFPVSDKAGDVLLALKKYLKKNKVEIMTKVNVCGFEIDNNKKRIKGVRVGEEIIYAEEGGLV